MPCSDSSSGINIYLDLDERLIKFQFAKITCSSEIGGNTGYSKYCSGKTLEDILNLRFQEVVIDLNLQTDEERQYVLFLEWEALRAGIAEYLGIEREDIDKDRCRISSIECDADGIVISEIVLPPKELPKILPCSLAERSA